VKKTDIVIFLVHISPC